MKKTTAFILSLCCSVSFAADNTQVQRGLDEITVAKEQTRLVMSQVTNNEHKERLRYINDRLTSAEDLLLKALYGGGSPNPRPPVSGFVEIYYSDSCSGSLIGTINPTTDCQKFAGASPAWGVKANGVCHNIQDTTAVKACEAFKGLGNNESIKIFNSDSCSGSLLAAVSAATQCDAFEATGSAAWAVEIGGQCHNITDSPLRATCHAFKAGSSPYATQIFHSDNCSSSPVAMVDGSTRCEDLKGLPDAWGVKINGTCQNINDMDIVTACDRFK